MNGSDARCLMALRAEPGSHVDVTETVSAVDKSAFINGITIRVVGPNVVSFEWIIEDRFDVTDYWILGTDTLGSGTVLGW